MVWLMMVWLLGWVLDGVAGDGVAAGVGGGRCWGVGAAGRRPPRLVCGLPQLPQLAD